MERPALCRMIISSLSAKRLAANLHMPLYNSLIILSFHIMTEEIAFIENPSSVSIERLVNLYRCVGWDTPRSHDFTAIQESFTGSSYVLLATRQCGEIIGYIRVLSDGARSTWIPEVVVHPEYQRKGLGKELVSTAMKQFHHTTIFLAAFPGHEKFWMQCGLAPRISMMVYSKIREAVPGLY
jgi:ribosomal protein S18 acetylase RimI-like enzyme